MPSRCRPIVSGLAALALSVVLLAAAAAAAEPFHPRRTEAPPVLDGRLDDAAWREYPPLEGFKTFIPDFGREPAERTAAYMAYDSENLYFAFKCYDREPAKIKAAVSGRDTIRSDDFVCINLDTFNDQQSLYALYVNPFGIQTDSRFASGKEDFSVDIVWYSAGRIDADGYTVELRVPFKSIRYAGRERVEMSIFFERRVSRLSEHASFPPLDPARGYFFLTQMMPLELRDIKSYTLLEVLPAFTYGRKFEREAAGLRGLDAARDLSLTGKYGFTSQLILDATWNPDFSQVEADAGQVDANLRYDLFFPEKRPFFLEGSEMFLLAGASTGDPLEAVVHTRRIVDPKAGLKLSGKLGRRDTVASIVAFDELPDEARAAGAGGRYAGFTIARYKHALAEDSYLGAFVTSRDDDGDFNRVAGADGLFRLGPSSQLGLHGFGSWTRGAAAAGTAAGCALGADYVYDTRNLGLGAGFHDVSRDFATDSGYLTRTDLVRLRASATPRFYPKSRFFRRVDVGLEGSALRDGPSGLWETDESLGVTVLFPGNTRLILQGDYATEIFLDRRFDTSGVLGYLFSQVTKQLSVTVQARRGGLIRYVASPYAGSGNRVTASAVFLPSENLNWTVSLAYADFFRKADGRKDFDYSIFRNRLTWQVNRYLFFRGIVEYNSFRRDLLTDFLASFTYIPGTVLQFGCGSLYDKARFEDGVLRESDRFLEMRRGVFFKASYLWRL